MSPIKSTELHADQQQIDLIYKLMIGSVNPQGDSDEAKMCRHLIQQEYARITGKEGEQKAIATLNGATLFRRYYNALSHEQAIEAHVNYLQRIARRPEATQ